MIQFGTGGWRAVIGEDFTKANVQILAKALATMMKDQQVTQNGIVLGYDRRFLSKEATIWACEVFAGEGIETYFINRSSPTPLMMFYVMKHEMHYGMAITASHNPAIYNGIKVFTYGGRDARAEVTEELETYIGQVDPADLHPMEYAKAVESGILHEINPLNEYIDAIIEKVDMEAIRGAGLKIVLDPMYGVSQTSLKTILLTARCDVEIIHERHDTLFGGKLPSPSAATLRNLQTFVIDHKYDIGIATDGDADRLGVIDDTGRFLHPNDILVLLYYYLVKYKGWTGPVVRNIATTHMLDQVAKSFGQQCYEVPVGFKYISDKMQEKDAVLGGESSGGLTVRGHINGKDGIYAAMLLIEMIAVTGKKLSQIYKEIEEECGSIYMEERDYKFSQEKKETIAETLLIEKDLPAMNFEVEKVSYLDGCKVYFRNGGWIIARFSGTEPLLRIFCEMPNSRDAKALCCQFEEFLELE